MQHQKVLILDFGGQYNQLIARRVREQGVFCDLMPSEMSLEKIKEYNPIKDTLIKLVYLIKDM